MSARIARRPFGRRSRRRARLSCARRQLLYDVRAAAAIPAPRTAARLRRRDRRNFAARGASIEAARGSSLEIEPMSSPRLSRRAFTLACASAALAACTSTGTKPTTGAAAPTNPPPREKPIRIGIALGGGAARGFAHVGVLKALEARGIPVELVAGTSAGSVVGALYASGMNALQINKLALTMDEASISDWATPFRSRGLLQGIALQNFINKTLNNRPIEKMAKPLGIVATDLKSGQPILFQRGNTGLAVRASCSVPSVFEPVRIGDREYVDGGLVSPVPASFARRMGADFVIAVDISSRPDGAATGNPIEMLLQTFTIMGQTIKTYELDKYADVVIRPNLAAMGGSDFNQRNAAILAGEEAVARIMPELQRKLAAAHSATAAA
ncbi:patatin-like phospholipase [Burkholderia humptydooensis MSMB43]|uniref:Patatin-like phospholipase n=1 Tax=Burkholderia humptydooensis MSMB43 TaxID=441157 RepID=A0ABN0G9R0_9BURK|nr:patatin-like phospholipase [Burkholderia humptydooensis MSMB43]